MLPRIDERALFPQPVVGVDEAGRGCLAGPVTAGAVILLKPQKFQDSKTLTPAKREFFAREIKQYHRFAVGMASVQEIEEQNIHQASLLAMKRAVKKLGLARGSVLVDGKFVIPGLEHLSQSPVVQGDKRVFCVSAAGILAKTERDRLLADYGRKYPQYGFEKHKAYPTPEHKKALRKYGPCPLHRRGFAGVRELAHLQA